MSSATSTLSSFSTLLDLACGRPVPDQGPARRTQLVLGASLAAMALAAIWGLAAGSSDLGLALTNAYKVPMVVLFSSLAALPAGMLALRLSDAKYSARELLMAFATSVFSGTLVLAVLSPIVAIYYHTSVLAGPYLAMGSTGLALVVGSFVFVRGTLRRMPEGAARASTIMPLAVIVTLQMGALLQLVALASPILPEVTAFDSGVDILAGR